MCLHFTDSWSSSGLLRKEALSRSAALREGCRVFWRTHWPHVPPVPTSIPIALQSLLVPLSASQPPYQHVSLRLWGVTTTSESLLCPKQSMPGLAEPWLSLKRHPTPDRWWLDLGSLFPSHSWLPGSLPWQVTSLQPANWCKRRGAETPPNLNQMRWIPSCWCWGRCFSPS